MVTQAAPSYSHATEPQAVANRSKFRAPADANGQSSNIMFDRRVVRGSTYAQPIDTPVRPPSPPARLGLPEESQLPPAPARRPPPRSPARPFWLRPQNTFNCSGR